MRILLVEDSSRLSDLIVEGLAKEGFQVDAVATVADALAALSGTHFALAILDLGLPDGDGLAVVKHLRGAGSALPLLVLTARHTTEEKVKGFHLGADDYLGKPFAFDELVARIRALLRRPQTYLGTQLQLGELTFDTVERQLVVRGDRHPMSPREAAILEVLLRRCNHVVPKTVLEDQLYGLSADGSANAVEVYVHRLRKQLDSLGTGIEVHTVRGVGYLIREAT
ncbi:MAG TPA: response regulator transcription factor [Rhizomicrobium sp.]|nr:response regulator transcription factor [Rhizomicrobium sp.]